MICFEKKSSENNGVRGMPLMSLVVLFYNQSAYAESTVSSALAQEYPNCEIVFSDDCSSDDTLNRILSAVKKYEGPHRVVVNSEKRNLGIGAHVRAVFPLCNGEWIITQGGDDISTPDRISVLSSFVSLHKDVSAVGVGAVEINEEGIEIGESKTVPDTVIYPCCRNEKMITCTLTPGALSTICLVTGAMAAYRKDVIELAPIPEKIVAEDVFFTHRAALVGSVAFLPNKCVLQRISSTSISRAGKGAKSHVMRCDFRKRISKMAYLSFDALYKEMDSYPFAVGEGYREYIESQKSALLLHCFDLGSPSPSTMETYLNAFRLALRRYSAWEVLVAAAKRGRGIFCAITFIAYMLNCVRVMLFRCKISLFKHVRLIVV